MFDGSLLLNLYGRLSTSQHKSMLIMEHFSWASSFVCGCFLGHAASGQPYPDRQHLLMWGKPCRLPYACHPCQERCIVRACLHSRPLPHEANWDGICIGILPGSPSSILWMHHWWTANGSILNMLMLELGSSSDWKLAWHPCLGNLTHQAVNS